MNYLLGKEDFQMIDSGNQKYLFLSDSLSIFKITDFKIEEYLRLLYWAERNAKKTAREQTNLKPA